MKIKIEAPHEHLSVPASTTRRLCEVLIPDPLKWVDLDAYPKLKAIVTPSTGTNHIDIAECNKRGIPVYSLLDDRPALNEISASAEFAFWHILNALRHGGFRQWNKYQRDDDVMRGHELQGKKVGLIGYGRIGKRLAKWLTAFDAKWDYADPKHRTDDNKMHLFETCDIVVICCSLTDDTRDMITLEYLSKMKPGAILINIARAEIIRENDLKIWIQKGQNTYAADVLHGEVHNTHSDLLKNPNCIITPHIAGTTYESQQKAMQIALKLAERAV